MQGGKFQPKVGEAGLFANTKTPDKSDVNGRIEIECPRCNQTQDYWVDGWRKNTHQGTRYLKIRLHPRQPRTGDAESMSSGATLRGEDF